MKVIKGNFSEKNKTTGSNKQKSANQFLKPLENKKTSYSEMLRDLINPYIDIDKTQGKFGLERLVQIGIVAWNLAVSKLINVPGFEQLFDTTMKEGSFEKDESEMLKKIMNESLEKYPGNEFFIENYELKANKNGTIEISISGKNLQDLVPIGDDEDFDFEDPEDEDIDELPFEPGLINRNAISLKYKPAYLEWLKKNDDFFDPQELRDSTVYLIEDDPLGEYTKWVKKNFHKIMINEFEEVTFDEKKWPARTYQVFCGLFEIQFHEMVMDLEDTPVIKNEPF